MDIVRKWVQALFFLITNGYRNFPATKGIYQGPLKVVCSPGLNCYSCPAATTYCPLGSLQQLFGGIRLAVQNGQMFIGLYVVGTMGVIGSFVGRMVCGWACPFGLFFAQIENHGLEVKLVNRERGGQVIVIVTGPVVAAQMIAERFDCDAA